MPRTDAILKLVKEQGASDLHPTAGSPPMIRIHGEVTALPHEPLTREACEALLLQLMASNPDLAPAFERLELRAPRAEAA